METDRGIQTWSTKTLPLDISVHHNCTNRVSHSFIFYCTCKSSNEAGWKPEFMAKRCQILAVKSSGSSDWGHLVLIYSLRLELILFLFLFLTCFQVLTCPEHDQEKLQFYCRSCQRLLCPLCKLRRIHSGHKILPVAHAYQALKVRVTLRAHNKALLKRKATNKIQLKKKKNTLK